jgi:hypothetical protein
LRAPATDVLFCNGADGCRTRGKRGLIRERGMIAQKGSGSRRRPAPALLTRKQTRCRGAIAHPESQRLTRDLLFLAGVERRVPRVLPLRVPPLLRRPPARFRALLRPAVPLRARPARAVFPDFRVRRRPVAASDDRRRAVPARPRLPERPRLRVFVRALRFFLLRFVGRALDELPVLPPCMSSSLSRSLSNRSL